MNILHGTWIPQASQEFVRSGDFCLWVETDAPPKKRQTWGDRDHPEQMKASELSEFVADELGLPVFVENTISTHYFIFPSTDTDPLPSLEMARYRETDPPEPTQWQTWAIDCYRVESIVKTLNDLHFLCLYDRDEVQMGVDLLFWYRYTQAFTEVIYKDRYIPGWKYREVSVQKGRSKRKTKSAEIYPIWEILSETYEENIQIYAECMPLACTAGVGDKISLYDRETLLRHFSEYLLNDIVAKTPIPASFSKKFSRSILLGSCLQIDGDGGLPVITGEATLEIYEQWRSWKQKLLVAQNTTAFNLCFQLEEATGDRADDWELQFLVSLKTDPSLKLDLSEYWQMTKQGKQNVRNQFGETFERDLLLNLGYAARIYPKLWQGLETDKPVGCSLTLAEAFDFLKESAWILEDAGYKVIVPAWWTPEGMQRAKIRLKATSSKKSSPTSDSKGYFQLETLISYQYELAIGGEPVSQKEWGELVEAKTPLVKFRGQWMELDRAKMQQMLEFWQTHKEGVPELSLLELMQKASAEEEGIEVETDKALAEMMAKLRDSSALQPIDDPQRFNGCLREYQKRGVAWIQYLEQLGLNGCLADDMGLGKTVQVIARLVGEREQLDAIAPTLLIAPTSVVSNWRKEIEKFAPQLQVMVHHGSDRVKDSKTFKKLSLQQDVVITSFALVRLDSKLFKGINWHRVVIDEAQNIKNPKAAQTKAILKLKSRHRLALTGTPVENRLLDLWSIFNFLNPGYLGKESQFRKGFEVPIQKGNDRVKSNILRKLVQPFILRRLKTDKQIVKDLPDKIQHKQFCNLTKEQASLYEAVVRDVVEQLAEAEGIQRKGLILATLMKLKQVCNHPRQFLQDSSEFTPERSHKLQRLREMVEEVFLEGESLLIFTQFTEIGDALQRYLKQELHCNTYYLHGGTSAKKRERYIAEFQDPNTEPSAFILSLKAGGVGITLTKANHVFHFDRWWNPAVENQATDRAFRIGQTKTVFVHKFVTVGTVEEQIDRAIEEKEKVASAIVGSDESWLTELDNESFKQLIALNKQAVV